MQIGPTLNSFRKAITVDTVRKTVTAIIVIAIITQTSSADKVCPNNNDLSYIHDEYCYSIHLEDFNYDDASSFCTQNGGTLWSKKSKEEIKFLERLYTKLTTFEYWIGWHYENDGWRHNSDGSSISTEHQMKSPSKKSQKCAALSEVDMGKGRLKHLSCLHELYAICEWTGKKCEQTKLGRNCFKFLDTKQNFIAAKSMCQREGGQLIELRNKKDKEIYEMAIKKDRAFEKLSDVEVKKQLSSKINVWKGQHEQSTSLYNEGLCEEYHNWVTSQLLCNKSANFICVYEAIENYENTENDLPEMTEQPPSDDTPQGDESLEEDETELIPDELPQNNQKLPIWAIVTMAIMGLAILILLCVIVLPKIAPLIRGNQGPAYQGVADQR